MKSVKKRKRATVFELLMGSVTIIVPVKDEEDGLNYLLEDYEKSRIWEIYEIDFIFVIDQRTTDSSRYIASKLPGKVLHQINSTGKGSAIKQAVEFWKNNITHKIIFLDADGSYSFDSVRTVLDALGGDSEVVTGSRFLGKAAPVGMTRLHTFGNRFLSKISSVINRRKISDVCTGLWGFKSHALCSLKIKSNGFDMEAEMMGLVRRNNLKHLEVGIEWSERKGGVSKLRSLRDGCIIFLRILKT